jgi:hypothetical protein
MYRGYYSGEVRGGSYAPYGPASVSASPWIAGYAWKTVPSYACYGCYASVETVPVFWDFIPAAAACANTTNSAYTLWAQPYQYCHASTPGNPVFSIPSNPISTQGLIITSCVLVFLASVAGCADSCFGEEKSAFAIGATCFSFLSMIILICSFSVWANWNWVLDVQKGSTGMPVWINRNAENLGAVQTVQVLGPGWGCALTAFILTFFSTCLHAGSLGAAKIATKESIPNIPPPMAVAKPVEAGGGGGATNMATAVPQAIGGQAAPVNVSLEAV